METASECSGEKSLLGQTRIRRQGSADLTSTLPHSWFAVHAVSMNYTNRMVSSDNMGYASYLMEQDKNGGQLPGKVRLGGRRRVGGAGQAGVGSGQGRKI